MSARGTEANSLWHIGVDEQLKYQGFLIHGCVDGSSGKIIYLRLSLDKEPGTVLRLFKEGVSHNGLPIQVAANDSIQNVSVAQFMQEEAGSNVQNPFMTSQVTRSLQVERVWAEVNRITSEFKMIFYFLQKAGWLAVNSEMDMRILCYIFFPRIVRRLETFKVMNNNARLQSRRYMSPCELWRISRVQQGHDVEDDAPYQEMTMESLESLFSSQAELSLFFNRARNIVPDPLVDDNANGMMLYKSLRDNFL